MKSSSVGLFMQGYKSLKSLRAVVIYATLVNTHTHIHNGIVSSVEHQVTQTTADCNSLLYHNDKWLVKAVFHTGAFECFRTGAFELL